MSERNYIPKEKIPRRIYCIYTKHKFYRQLKGDIVYFFKEYKRKKYLFKKDEWIFNKQLTEEEFRHEVFKTDKICLPGCFNYHNLIIEGEEYCDVGWD